MVTLRDQRMRWRHVHEAPSWSFATHGHISRPPHSVTADSRAPTPQRAINATVQAFVINVRDPVRCGPGLSYAPQASDLPLFNVATVGTTGFEPATP
jgi:hypothetical protein